MFKDRKLFFLFLFIAVLTGFLLQSQIEDFFLRSKNKLIDFKKELVDEVIESVEVSVSAPPPLQSEKESLNPILTRAGTIRWTNINRQNNNLLALRESEKLNEAALKKARDIFEKQYFDHISPSGKGSQDLAAEVGYSFIAVGENLAMGNFANDRELLEAWMASPGHRENILSKKFTEIGVAVLQGEYQGKKTWVAVQEFGTPLSNCPVVDANLKKIIESNTEKNAKLSSTLEEKKEGISRLRFRDSSSREKIDEYNALVEEYNALVTKTKKQVETYNSQVSSFNECVRKYQ